MEMYRVLDSKNVTWAKLGYIDLFNVRVHIHKKKQTRIILL